MSLPVKNLDDRNFQELVDEAKRKIPELCPAWTNHNVSDPGVALIELFAWMTEMAIFRLNQFPDVFYTRMLNLLDFDRFPAKAARTDLTFWLTTGVPKQWTIPRRTEVGTVGGTGDQVIFSTVDDVVIVQPDLIEALTQPIEDGKLKSVLEDLKPPDLEKGQAGDVSKPTVPCFAPPDDESDQRPRRGACFYLGFANPLGRMAINVTVTTDKAQGIGIVPTDPPFVWEIWDGTTWVAAEVPRHDHTGRDGDTTGGLNRNGTVLILVPERHERRMVDNRTAYWLRARVTREQPPGDYVKPGIGYAESPQLATLEVTAVGAVARAEHAARVTDELLGTSTGKPAQSFFLRHHPVLAPEPTGAEPGPVAGDLPPPSGIPVRKEAGVAVQEGSSTPNDILLGGAGHDGASGEWRQVTSFAGSGPFDRHYVVDTTTGEVRFGPSIRYPGRAEPMQHGMVPPRGARIVMREYRYGGGSIGNVGPGTLTGLRHTLSYVEKVTNFEAAKGGVDAEGVDEAKRRAPMWIRGGDRAVTARDFERLALEAHPGIARAYCRPTFETGQPIRVLLVPRLEHLGRELVLDDLDLTLETRDAVMNYLDERRVLGTTLEIGVPFYQGVSVVALVNKEAKSAASADAVRSRVESALYAYIDPLHGGANGAGWEFDRDVTAAGVTSVIEALDGVGSVARLLLFDQDARRGERLGAGKETIQLATDSLPLSGQHRVVVQ